MASETFYYNVAMNDGSITFKCGNCEADITTDDKDCFHCKMHITDEWRDATEEDF